MKLLNPKIYMLFGLLSLINFEVLGQTLPGSADSSRIDIRPKNLEAPIRQDTIQSPKVILLQTSPAGAKEIKFILRSVVFKGNTVFSENAFKDFYGSLIGKEVSLDLAWDLTGKVTKLYRDQGYFLSRAYVPAQTIEDGVLHINIAEGFIENINVSGEVQSIPTLNAWIERIKLSRPITSQKIEQAISELNTIPGVSFRAILSPPSNEKGEDGGSSLELVTSVRKGNGSIRFDNDGSRYLGPYEIGASYNQSFISGQNTNISVLSSVPLDELKSFALRQTMPIIPQLSAELSGNYSVSTPGYTLKVQDIKSKTYVLSAAASYQWIRQRDESLSTRMGFDWVNSQSDILGSPLSYDDIRILRLGTTYSFFDSWAGYSLLNFEISKGIDAFGASKKGDLDISRAEATPDFTKIQANVSRVQNLPNNFQVLFGLSGQMASAPLYSSEEFGFGGRGFGRAYDGSEIVGDEGIKTSLQIKYAGISPVYGLSSTPYVFYDIGKVWNKDNSGQTQIESASSAGFGVQLGHPSGLTADLGLAYPLTKTINNPIYNSGSKAPRLMFSASYDF